MGGHLPLAGIAHPVTFFGMGQNNRGLPLMTGGSRVSSINFNNIMTATSQPVYLFITHALNQMLKCFILSEKMVPVKCTIVGSKGLHLPINGFAKGFCQGTGQVFSKQGVPVAAP